MNKKIIIFIIPIICFFIGINKTKALDDYYITRYYDQGRSSIIESNIKVPSEIIENYFTTDKTTFLNNVKNLKYGYSQTYNNFYKLENGDFDNYLNTYDSYIIYATNSNNKNLICFFDKENLIMTNRGNNNPLKLSFSALNSVCYQNDNKVYKSYSVSDTSQNTAFTSYYNQLLVSEDNTIITSFEISTSGGQMMYLSSEDLIEKFFGAKDDTPQINFIKDKEFTSLNEIGKEEITKINYKINFSNFNTDKYKYYYSYDFDKFEEITENDLILSFYYNTSFVVKVEDLEKNIVNSASFTIVSFNINEPYLTMTEDNTDCTFEVDGVSYKTCSNIYVDSHIFDTNTYSLQVNDPTNDLGFVNMNTITPSGTYPIHTNGTYIFRIIKNDNKEVIDSYTYVVSTISEDYSNVGKKINSECWWNGEEMSVDCKYHFYNYDETESSIYKYYYSNDNGETYELLTEKDFSQQRYVVNYRNMKISYKENSFVKIILKADGEEIYEYSHFVDYNDYYQRYSGDVFVFWSYKIKKKITEKFPIINQFNEITDSFNYNPKDNEEPPTFELDLSKLNFLGLNMNEKVKIIDFSFYKEYREDIFFWIKLSVGLATLFKAYRIIKYDYFGGGD